MTDKQFTADRIRFYAACKNHFRAYNAIFGSSFDIANWSQVGWPNESIKVTNRAVSEPGAGVLFEKKALKGLLTKKTLR